MGSGDIIAAAKSICRTSPFHARSRAHGRPAHAGSFHASMTPCLNGAHAPSLEPFISIFSRGRAAAYDAISLFMGRRHTGRHLMPFCRRTAPRHIFSLTASADDFLLTGAERRLFREMLFLPSLGKIFRAAPASLPFFRTPGIHDGGLR